MRKLNDGLRQICSGEGGKNEKEGACFQNQNVLHVEAIRLSMQTIPSILKCFSINHLYGRNYFLCESYFNKDQPKSLLASF